jgi:hypothetical protein
MTVSNVHTHGPAFWLLAHFILRFPSHAAFFSKLAILGE